jgi:tetratricopeptide (TPR) repeat protein
MAYRCLGDIMQTTTFFSYKGGTGRSLAVANAATYLSQLGFRVAVLDFDLEAPGLNYKLSRAEDGSPVEVNFGLVDYLHRIVVDKEKPDSIKKYAIEVNLLGNDFPPIVLIPAGKVPSIEYWRKLSKLDWHELFYTPGALGVEIFLDLKLRIEKEIAPDFLLVDSRTGITEIGGIATTILPDTVICILLNNRENMEGSRAVLRSLQNPANAKEIKVIVALSRLPVLKDKEPEVNILNHIKNFLMEGAEDQQNSLLTDQIFVLHSEPALQMRETLRVASGLSLDESVLLRDYLRLFAQFIPAEAIESRLGRLIRMAKDKIWDDPDAATKQMEEIAEFYITPQSLMDVLKLYNLRTMKGMKVLKTAQKYWEITGNAKEPILYTIVKSNFEMQPKWKPREWDPDLRFIEAVWLSTNDPDPVLGNALGEACYEMEENATALRVYRKLLDLDLDVTQDTFKYIPAKYLHILRTSNIFDECRAIIEQFKSISRDNFLFVFEWAKVAILLDDDAYISELSQDDLLLNLFTFDPEIANSIAKRSGKIDFAIEHLALLIKKHQRSPHQLAELGNFFRESGAESIFQDALSSLLPGPVRDEVQVYMRRLPSGKLRKSNK